MALSIIGLTFVLAITIGLLLVRMGVGQRPSSTGIPRESRDPSRQTHSAERNEALREEGLIPTEPSAPIRVETEARPWWETSQTPSAPATQARPAPRTRAGGRVQSRSSTRGQARSATNDIVFWTPPKVPIKPKRIPPTRAPTPAPTPVPATSRISRVEIQGPRKPEAQMTLVFAPQPVKDVDAVMHSTRHIHGVVAMAASKLLKRVELVLATDNDAWIQVAQRVGIPYVDVHTASDVLSISYNYMFDLVRSSVTTPWVGFINSDIVLSPLMDRVPEAMSKAKREGVAQWLFGSGIRMHCNVPPAELTRADQIDDLGQLIAHLTRTVHWDSMWPQLDRACAKYTSASSEIFVYDRNFPLVFSDLPLFLLGGVAWDNFVVEWAGGLPGVQTLDIGSTVHLYHLSHGNHKASHKSHASAINTPIYWAAKKEHKRRRWGPAEPDKSVLIMTPDATDIKPRVQYRTRRTDPVAPRGRSRTQPQPRTRASTRTRARPGLPAWAANSGSKVEQRESFAQAQALAQAQADARAQSRAQAQAQSQERLRNQARLRGNLQRARDARRAPSNPRYG